MVRPYSVYSGTYKGKYEKFMGDPLGLGKINTYS